MNMTGLAKMKRLSRRLIRDTGGMAFVELALVAPVLLLLLLGAIDMSRLISARIDLEQAAQRTTDFALSRRPTNSNTNYLVAEASAATGLPAANITAQLFLECNGVRITDFKSGCAVGQTSARYVSIRILDNVDPLFDWSGLAGLLGAEGFNKTFVVTGDSVVRIQ